MMVRLWWHRQGLKFASLDSSLGGDRRWCIRVTRRSSTLILTKNNDFRGTRPPMESRIRNFITVRLVHLTARVRRRCPIRIFGARCSRFLHCRARPLGCPRSRCFDRTIFPAAIGLDDFLPRAETDRFLERRRASSNIDGFLYHPAPRKLGSFRNGVIEFRVRCIWQIFRHGLRVRAAPTFRWALPTS